MFIFYELPVDIMNKVYTYDDTYTDVFNEGPLSELSQIKFYRMLITRNKMYIAILKSYNPDILFEELVYKELIKELKLVYSYKNKVKNLKFYEKLYGLFGRLYINCRRKTFVT